MIEESFWRADLARVRWALEGGLKEESKMRSVLGDGGVLSSLEVEVEVVEVVGLMVCTMRKREWDDWKDRREEERSGSRERNDGRAVVMLWPSRIMMRIVVLVRHW